MANENSLNCVYIIKEIYLMKRKTIYEDQCCTCCFVSEGTKKPNAPCMHLLVHFRFKSIHRSIVLWSKQWLSFRRIAVTNFFSTQASVYHNDILFTLVFRGKFMHRCIFFCRVTCYPDTINTVSARLDGTGRKISSWGKPSEDPQWSHRHDRYRFNSKPVLPPIRRYINNISVLLKG